MHRVFDYVLPYRQKKTTFVVEKVVTNAQSFRLTLKCYLGFGSESKLVFGTKVFYFVFSVVWKLRVGDIGNVCPLGFE